MRNDRGQTSPSQHAADQAVTRQLGAYAGGISLENLPADAVRVARHCILDWLGVTLAGASEPLVDKLADLAAAEGLGDDATLVGRGARGSVSQAALINGAAGHALDYDDVLREVHGHPTVPVAPVALAMAERDGKSGADVLTAFLTGVELDSRIGNLLTDAHYLKGWHGTATIGTFGAAAAGARMLGLDADGMVAAIGLAGTQASGLKSMFGTMAKPLHAGKAAMNGALAAELAKRGFTCSDAVLDDPQGFQAVSTPRTDPEAALAGLGRTFYTRNVLFKYHAACYGTHAGMECALAMRGHPAFDVAKIERADLAVPMRTLAMCNIWEPETGLEIKFSHRMTLAQALAGANTGDPNLYDAATAATPAYQAIRDKVTVRGEESFERLQSELVLHLSNGAVLREARDMDIPNPDLDGQERKLEAKFQALARPVIGAAAAEEVRGLVAGLQGQDAAGVCRILELCSGTA